ncbi:DNA-binding response regulator [Solemya pervernicosa gill symbiont]|uniref:DNA-binding response regulator n=2 Tax=Gammaproteobacteria incertae sedis TaxID=118884 RepID=A0A1T2L2B6_9GAMM|nr:response regulator transcription factor [Candidatus Reidiella endopervernicosa]OOZ39222.1 DNA-binding response regulator [Solemya pervernicosa gill symbiont]QKQ28069.1 response regulator transcription factor [Candidatus Reidiella endopervernicosa]
MHTILLIDDDERLAELLGRYFKQFDLQLESANLPSQGLARLKRGGVDLVILDVMMPEMDGFEVCKQIRHDSEVPIVMLTARGEVMDRVVGLELGADDYLPKPFEPRELVARIQNIFKRSERSRSDEAVMRFGDLAIDTALQQATLADEVVQLSSTEYRMLELLVRQAGKTLSRDEILNQLKGVEVELFTRSVDIAISRLRQKLKPAEFIKTVRGSGYCFVGRVS